MIDVVDYRAGNGPSVVLALEKLGIPARLVGTPDDLARAERIILPGVGAARATLSALRDAGLLPVLERKVRVERVPFLGICIGLQILFDHSEEDDTPCLGWIPGRVRRFSPDRVRVPQMGWNEVRFQREHALSKSLPPSGHYYFVNSYYADPVDPSVVLGEADYGGPFCAVVVAGNVAATQFHAEKSGGLGLRLLENFARGFSC